MSCHDLRLVRIFREPKSDVAGGSRSNRVCRDEEFGGWDGSQGLRVWVSLPVRNESCWLRIDRAQKEATSFDSREDAETAWNIFSVCHTETGPSSWTSSGLSQPIRVAGALGIACCRTLPFKENGIWDYIMQGNATSARYCWNHWLLISSARHRCIKTPCFGGKPPFSSSDACCTTSASKSRFSDHLHRLRQNLSVCWSLIRRAWTSISIYMQLHAAHVERHCCLEPSLSSSVIGPRWYST